jgi:IclR family mhp operon transcriptional activator
MDERQEVKSVKKALRALTFLNANGESTVTQVAWAIGVPRTTSYRLLETLVAEGYVEKQLHSDVYRLTSLVERLSVGFTDTDLVVEVAKPIIRRLGGEIGWPLALATPRGKDMVVRVTTDYDTSLAIDRYMIGFATPILHAPAGFCFLAYSEDEVRESILEIARTASPQPEILRNGGKYLTQILNNIRAKGFCHICFSEYKEGGLAVPLLVGGRAVGGIVMRYIKSTVKPARIESEYFDLMRQLASDISAAYEARANHRTLQAEANSLPGAPLVAAAATGGAWATPQVAVAARARE